MEEHILGQTDTAEALNREVIGGLLICQANLFSIISCAANLFSLSSSPSNGR